MDLVDPEKLNYPVWRTQGNGLVRSTGGRVVFIKPPNCLAFKSGDVMPADWKPAPANEKARELRRQEPLFS